MLLIIPHSTTRTAVRPAGRGWRRMSVFKLWRMFTKDSFTAFTFVFVPSVAFSDLSEDLSSKLIEGHLDTDDDLCVFQSFKLNVDSHSALKESIMEEGRALLSVITSHQSGIFSCSFIPPTHSHTHTGGHNRAPTLFHSLLISGLTEWPSERRTHMNVAERKTERDKGEEWDGEAEIEKQKEKPAGGNWLAGRETFNIILYFSQRERGKRGRDRSNTIKHKDSSGDKRWYNNKSNYRDPEFTRCW